MRKGPLLVHDEEEDDVKQAARNLPGVDTCSVQRLNILQLAPGGHLGRFLIFTKAGFKALNTVFGSYKRKSEEKSGYSLNRHVMTCADIARIINSDQVQAKLREQRQTVVSHSMKKNPLTNKALMTKLNPFAKKRAELIAAREADRHGKRAAAVKASRAKAGKQAKAKRTKLFFGLNEGLEKSFKDAEDLIAEEQKAGNYVPGETDEEEDD